MLEMIDDPRPATAQLQPMAHRCIVSLAAYPDMTAKLKRALGVKLPVTPFRVSHLSSTYLWAGEGRWLVLSENPALESNLRAVAKSCAAITDQSDGRFLLRVTGSNRRDVLARLVPIDLHESVFAPDATALTLAGHISIQLWQEEDSFVLSCASSYADALYESLHAASREFEPPPLVDTSG